MTTRLECAEDSDSGEGSVLWGRERQECIENEELEWCVDVMDRFAFIEYISGTNACSSECEGGGVEGYTETDEVLVGDGVQVCGECEDEECEQAG